MEIHEITNARVKALNVGQKDLSDMLDISQPQISAALNGKNEKTLHRIIKILIEKYGLKERDFYPDDNERLIALEHEVKKMSDKVDQLYNIVIDRIKN